MYILERLQGIITYSSILMIICILILKLPKKKIGSILLIYTFLLSLMGFLYVPASGADLYRIIPIMHIYANQSISEICISLLRTSTPVATLYYFIIGKLGIDGLLPAISAFITYSNLFYIFKQHIKKNEDIEKKDIALTLFFIMSTGFFIHVISNIRTMLAFSIIAKCIYNEIYNRKNLLKNIPMYIVASFIHSAALAVSIIRIVFYIFIEKKDKKNKLLKKIAVITIAVIIYFLASKTYITSMFTKINHYFYEGTYFLMAGFIKSWILILEIIIVNIYYKKNIKCKGKSIYTNNMVNFSCILNIIVILVNYHEYNIFSRFTYLNTLINIPIIMDVLKEKNSTNKLEIIIFILSMIALIISITRGSMSSLKFY